MNVVDHTRLETAALPGIEHRTLAGSDIGLKQLSVWQQTLDAGQATPPHRHDCEEVVVVSQGSGELHIEGRVERFGPEQTLVIPRNVPHQIVNTGSEAIRLVAAFAMTPVVAYFPDGSELPLPWKS
jgi:quercetin dioxygenase-like cupin family protein